MKESSTREKSYRGTGVGSTMLILGPQGAGKGTQATLLAQRQHWEHLEVGAMLRAVSRQKNSATARRVAGYIDAGRLVPFTWVLRLLDERIARLPKGKGVLIDGSPRRIAEAKSLLRMLRTHFHRTVTMAFFVSISRKESVRRLSRRWICTVCQRSLIMGKDVRRPADMCPHCGGTIMQRPDDTPKAIKKRLAIYYKETRPVIRFLREKRLLTQINGEQPIPAVADEFERSIRKLFADHVQRNNRRHRKTA